MASGVSVSLETVEWHEGEKKMHMLLRVPEQRNPVTPFLAPGAGTLVHRAPLLALGCLDKDGRPWTTLWGGERGFARPVGGEAMAVSASVDREHDPVLRALLGDRGVNEVVQHEEKGPILSGLAIDLERRNRVKLFGRMKAGGTTNEGVGGFLFEIEGSLGNCPKYINKKAIEPCKPDPQLVSESSQLCPEALELLETADMFFISTSNGQSDMDTNIRGGSPGFCRLLSNESSGAVVVYPEYSGNRLYQTLGNLQTTPKAGLCVPDFDTGDVLFLTGGTEVLMGSEAAALLPHSNVAVKILVTSAWFVRGGLPFRGIPGERSPYNPPVRHTVFERPDSIEKSESDEISLVAVERITPTISRYTFRTEDPVQVWKPGQHAVLDFADYLDQGYKHMCDDDPLSVNDDYIRTFTISSHPPSETGTPEFDLTIRNVGRVTDFLSRRNPQDGFKLNLRGFGGSFFLSESDAGIVYVAAGIGITPLLSQLPSLMSRTLHLFWSVRICDIELINHVFDRFPQLKQSTTLFITGENSTETNYQPMVESLSQSTIKVERRRITEHDLTGLTNKNLNWYLCVAPQMKSHLLNWLSSENVIHEDFGY
ncbi:hypothetical protein TRICI_000679 [Trichomonascus ciferrii]|uniref:FAD-binding FR-type domain-containing protein n=1 Tax=Trichomonascus ciferrii TaxID=44093 RepID=A0A642VC21_9ASCO|nr:hypothetical protein TRICI_000679 [Trichomonascus ciferrii]